MTLNVRIYDTEDNAKAADSALAKAGFTERSVFLPSKSKGKERATVQAAIEKGQLPARNVLICTQTLEKGRALVSVEAPFGSGQAALKIMDGIKGVDGDLLSRYVPSDPSPFSDSLGWSTLSNSEPSSGLLRHDWAFSRLFGMGLLSDKAAPFSSMFGMKVLSAAKKNWNSSFGMPMLSNKAAPLSSMFGMTTVLKSKRNWEWSWGLPLLSKNPAPFSSLLGLKTLSKPDR